MWDAYARGLALVRQLGLSIASELAPDAPGRGSLHEVFYVTRAESLYEARLSPYFKNRREAVQWVGENEARVRIRLGD